MGSTASKQPLAKTGRLGPKKKLPDAVRKPMERSFRTDFSEVGVYESPLVAQNGAQAAASGTDIAFAPGKADFSSEAGRALLGHELSHIASQAKGEVHGGGFLKDPALERRADSEGERAAREFSAFDSESGKTLSPMSTSGANVLGAPMQARKGGEKTRMDPSAADKAAWGGKDAGPDGSGR